jgi:hypothetical protein
MSFRTPAERDLPETRPATVSEARELIGKIFAENRWDAYERRRYLKAKGYNAELYQLTPEGVRAVIAAMEQSRMVIFR